jgi:hypothetical protein
MESSVIDLSKYRFENAQDDLEAARILLKDNRFKVSKSIDTAFRYEKKRIIRTL